MNSLAAEFNDSAAARQAAIQHQVPFQGQIRRMFPGQVSNYEMKLYQSAVPTPWESGDVVAKKIGYMSKVAQHAKDQGAFYSNLAGRMPVSEINDLWAKYSADNPIFFGYGGNRRQTDVYPSEAFNEVVLNTARLSPSEWLEQVENPDASSRLRLLAARQPHVDNLPPAIRVEKKGSGVTVATGMAAEEGAFARAKDPKDQNKWVIVPNDAYWISLERARRTSLR